MSAEIQQRAIFARKPGTLEDACFCGRPERITILDSRHMTEAEYDIFSRNLGLRQKWLAEFGARQLAEHRAGMPTPVLEVTGPNRKTLYINPEGGDWARYVGIAW